MSRGLFAVIALSAALGSAHAAPGGTGKDSVDWATGLVTAEGVGLADRHAPNPAVARGTSRRAAEAEARKRLATAIAKLPVAGGGTVGERAKQERAVAARIDLAIDAALPVSAEPETDGAWRVTLGVPVEAIRQALTGPRTLAVGAADTGPTVVVVDDVKAKPAVGFTVGGIAGASLWVKDVPAWAATAPHVKASSVKAGTIEVDGMTATPATLFVIVTTGTSTPAK